MSDRKYRQSGYKDDDRGGGGGGGQRAGGGPGGPPRERREGPRGRGLGAPTESAFRCAACGKTVEAAGGAVTPDAACPYCKADLHSCTNCLHFDPSAPAECRRHEEIPVRVPRKAQANTCPVFSYKEVKEFAGERGGTRDARAAFDALFNI